MAMELIDQAIRDGARQRKACELVGITSRTLRRWRKADALEDRRKGAAKVCAHALSDEEKEAILAVCNAPENQSLPPSQIVPKLADQGIYIASESTFYRVLAEYEQNNRRGRAKPPRKVAKPKALDATGPNQVWSWDITYLPTAVRGAFYRLYMVMDIYSRKIVGWEIHEEELASHASELMHQACRREKVAPGQLTLHADNGAPMKGATMLATLQKLGVMPSFSRPSVSDDNPYSEALFHSLKYVPSWPKKPFESIDDARSWVHIFVDWYNNHHRHSGIRFVTPQERHEGKDRQTLAKRTKLYELAKTMHPLRWRGRKVRNWTPPEIVWLNPDRDQPADTESEKLAA